MTISIYLNLRKKDLIKYKELICTYLKISLLIMLLFVMVFFLNKKDT